MPLQRQYLAKVFDKDGSTFLKNFTTGRNGKIKNVPTFSARVNGGYGECVLDLNLPFDDFDEGTSIEFMNIVKIYAVTIESKTQTETLIYTGFISEYEPYIDGTREEGVRVTLLGLVSLLTFSYYKSGASFTVTHSSDDPETIGREIIDHVNSIYTASYFSYDNDSTDAVGTAVSATFTDKKWFDALKMTGEVAGTNWWWKIAEDGKYWLKAKPSSATHTFTIGKDVDSITAPKNAENIVNDVDVRWSSGTAADSDSTSQTNYLKRTKIVNESGLTDSSAGTQRAAKEVDDNKDPKIRATVVVNSKYDLESIKVGETCQIANYNKDSTFFNSNMMIAATHYLGDLVRVELDQEATNFARELDSFVNG